MVKKKIPFLAKELTGNRATGILYGNKRYTIGGEGIV
jgi:hypothetical protein